MLHARISNGRRKQNHKSTGFLCIYVYAILKDEKEEKKSNEKYQRRMQNLKRS